MQNKICALVNLSPKRIYGLLACLALAGCAADMHYTDLGGGVHEISHTEPDFPGGDGPNWQNAANNNLTYYTKDVCPNGYDKLGERVIRGERNSVVWKIRCL